MEQDVQLQETNIPEESYNSAILRLHHVFRTQIVSLNTTDELNFQYEPFKISRYLKTAQEKYHQPTAQANLLCRSRSESENLVYKYFDVDNSDILPEEHVLELMKSLNTIVFIRSFRYSFEALLHIGT